MKILANRRTNFRYFSNLSKPARMLFFAVVVSLFGGLILIGRELRLIVRQTENFLEREKRKQSTESEIAFEKIFLTAHPAEHIRFLQNRRNVRNLAVFQNSVFAATETGLAEFSENGQLKRQLTTLDGLPESDLTALTVFQSKLFIGTRSKGLIRFDGQVFEQFRLKNHETHAINVFFSDERTLLIGTSIGGLLEFDGHRLQEIKAVEKRLENPIFIEHTNEQLMVGTFSAGLWIRQQGVWKQFSKSEGLLSDRIVSAQIINSKLFAATDLGISSARVDDLFTDNPKPFAESADLPTLSAVVFLDESLYLSKDNGEIFRFNVNEKLLSKSKLVQIGSAFPNSRRNAKLQKIEDKVYLLTNEGISLNKGKSEFSFENFEPFSDQDELADNSISAIAFDSKNRLWIGNFRYGIEIFSDSLKKIKHLQTEIIREINHFAFEASSDSMIVSTSGGIESINLKFETESIKENLPSRSVFQTAFQNADKKQIFTASTAKGLFYRENQRLKNFTNLQGLPSNSAYTTLFTRDSLFVGTLAGLAEIRNGRVIRAYKTSNSALKNNWINALCLADQRVFIGTYGGGAYELLPSGEIYSFEPAAGLFFVNPNAVFSDGERVFFGTLDGLRVFDLTTRKWRRIVDVLPSATVLALNERNGKLYVGTTAGLAIIDRPFWNQVEL